MKTTFLGKLQYSPNPVVQVGGSLFKQLFIKNYATVKSPAGVWKFQQYAFNIIKAVFRPEGYTTNELVSDAVVLKPMQTAPTLTTSTHAQIIHWDNITIQVIGNSIVFGENENALIVNYHDEGHYYRGFQFHLKENEKIFGGGERALPLNRRGFGFGLNNKPAYGYSMWTHELNYSVPFITSSNNYALFFDNSSVGYLDIGKKNHHLLEYGAMSGELNFYLITGRSYPELLTSYHTLTGTQPLPPRWAMGNLLSRFGYISETEVKEIMQQMREHKILFDAVIFDLFWFGNTIQETMGNFDWVNKKAWPNPSGMIKKFKKEGVQTILITEPFILQKSLSYKVSKKYHAVDKSRKPYVLTQFYFGLGGLIDIFRNDSKRWLWSKYKSQMKRGVEGWWGDLGEPETHPYDMYHNLKDFGFKRLFRSEEVHNVYGHYWSKMLFERYKAEYPGKRLFNLNRSGFAGTQRYSIFPWTGDVSRSWSGLQAQLPVLLGMSMSGVPYVHSDAGGFAHGEKDPELYIRWLQFAAYTPIFRPHGTELSKVDPFAGNYPSEPALFDEPYKSIAKEVINNRYRLLPYNYNLTYEHAKSGKPLMSPMYYYYSKDTITYHAEDQFMWGEHMLVAPVLHKGAQARSVYLPEGDWYHYVTHEKFRGKQWINKPLVPHRIPVYVKEGSFIPTVTGINNTGDYKKGNFIVTYYPSDIPTAYLWYQDDGASPMSITKNNYSLIHFAGQDKAGEITITATCSPNQKYLQKILCLQIPAFKRKPKAVYVKGRLLKIDIVNNAISSKIPLRTTHARWNTDDRILTIQVPVQKGTTTKVIVKRG